LALWVAVPVSQGCYSYVPIETNTPPLGETVALEITDQGRAVLADRFGQGLLRVEGLVTEVDSEIVALSVFRVSQLSGNSRWSGETVRVGRGYVGRFERRQLSRPRTFLLAGGLIGGFAVVVVSQGLFGTGAEGDSVPDDGGGPQQIRICCE
jgi:hypothetical protein